MMELALVLALVIGTLIIIEDYKRKITIDYLYRILNELAFLKATVKRIEEKVEEINRRIEG